MTTETTTCPLGNHTTQGEGICNNCHAKIHSQLDDLLELWQAAHHELLPGKGGHGSSGSERTIGLNVSALSFIAGNDILNLLWEWEKTIRRERRLTPPALLPSLPLEEEIATAVAFAQTHLAWSGTQDWIGEYAFQIKDLHGTATAAARRFVEKVRRIPCPADTEEGLPCGYLLPVKDDDLLEFFTCKRCRSEWTSFRLIAVALSNPEGQFWLDAEAIASWLGINERAVKQLADRYNVPKRGQLYDFKAIMKAKETVA